jgi:Adenylate and Guanylate cyclase catalytic domain
MESPPLERKLIAILAADVAGYSRMMGIDETGALATLSAHRAIVDSLVDKHGGRICNTAGDSVLAEFTSVFASIHCAVEIQRELAEANSGLTEDRRMWFRIGINVGDVMVKDGDIFGDGVNIAARIEGWQSRAESVSPGGCAIMLGGNSPTPSKILESKASRILPAPFGSSASGLTNRCRTSPQARKYPSDPLSRLPRRNPSKLCSGIRSKTVLGRPTTMPISSNFPRGAS